MAKSLPLSLNVAEAKRRLSDLLGRVAFAGETVLITRRGRPMARLVPAVEASDRLGMAPGFLDDDDPFFAAVDEVVASRGARMPRALKSSRTRPRKR